MQTILKKWISPKLLQSRALVVGGTGLLGVNILSEQSPIYKLCGTVHKRHLAIEGVQLVKVDLLKIDEFETLLESYQPALIINCAGYTNVDLCEQDEQTANYINAELPSRLAEVSHSRGIKFVHISTDHLFDGQLRFVSEDEPLSPLNIYAKSKALGEQNVLLNASDALIVRSNFFGWGTSYRKSFSDFIIDRISTGERVKLANDVFFTPVFIQKLISAIYDLVKLDACGIYNVVGKQRVSKFEFGQKIAKIFDFDESLIVPVSMNCLKTEAPRPRDMSLCTHKLFGKVGYDLGSVDDNITSLKELMHSNQYKVIKKL